tara:strand:+ start:405 stop:563 length:159 start_codon:yes stop_codon:yes gene_type:complete
VVEAVVLALLAEMVLLPMVYWRELAVLVLAQPLQAQGCFTLVAEGAVVGLRL